MKPILQIFFLMTILLLSGCGSQDRYEVMDPHVHFIIEGQDWGTATAVPTVHNSFNPSPAAVVDGRFYFGSRGGMIYVVTPTGYETLPRPGELYVRDLITGPDGLLWMTDNNGRVLYFQDGQWVLDVDLDLDWDSGTRMLLDNQNRILLMGDREDIYHRGNTRGLWRREESGQWSQQDLPGDPDIMHGWCENGQPPIFLTRHLELITEERDGWQISDPVWENIDREDVELQCSQEEAMAIRLGDDRDFLLNEGDGWQLVEGHERLRHLFWFENELYSVMRYENAMYRWEADGWVFSHEFSDLPSSGHVWSLALDSRRVLYFPHGGSLIFDGHELTQNTSLLGYPKAVVRYGGMDHLYMSESVHLQGTGGVWEVVGRPFESENRSSINKKMLVDDQDQLVFFSYDEIITWDGVNYHRQVMDQDIYRTYLQEDRKVLILSDGQVGVWSQGELRWIGHLDEFIYDVIGAQWVSDEKIQVLTRTHLLLVEPDRNTIALTFQGWAPKGGASGPGSSLAAGGIRRMVVIEDENVQDITPHWGTVQGEGSRISTMIADGLGGWIVYDYDRSALLRFDGENWFDMGTYFWNSIYENGTLTSNGDGTFILQDYGYVYHIEPGAVP